MNKPAPRPRNYRDFCESEILTFLEGCIAPDIRGRISGSNLYGAFTRWWDARPVESRPWSYTPPEPSQTLFSRIVGQHVAVNRTASGSTFLGIKLK